MAVCGAEPLADELTTGFATLPCDFSAGDVAPVVVVDVDFSGFFGVGGVSAAAGLCPPDSADF